MDDKRVKWTKVKLDYNKYKNQWRMIYSTKSIPLGEDEMGIKRYKPVRKIIPVPIPLGYYPTFDPKTKQEIKLPRHKIDHNKKRLQELRMLESEWKKDLTNQIYHINQNSTSGERFSEWAIDWLNNQTFSKSYLKNLLATVVHVKKVEDVHFLSIDTAFINRFIKHLNDLKSIGKLEQTTVRSYYERFMLLLTNAEKEKKIHGVEQMFSGANKVEYGESKIGNYFSEEELRVLAATPCRNNIMKMAFLFNCLTGIRISECINLKWKDIKEKDGRITADILTRKNKHSQVIPLSNSAVKFMPERRGLNDNVFLALTYSDMNNKLTEWVKSSGLERIGKTKTHDARRTCGALIWKKTKNIDTVAKFLNHKNISETFKYLRKFLGDTFDEIDANEIMPDITI
jgi:integrase